MTPQQREDSVLRASLILLKASNVVADADAALEGSEEFRSLADVLMTAHFYAKESSRALRRPLSELSLETAQKMAAARKRLAKKLIEAAELLTANGDDTLDAATDFIAEVRSRGSELAPARLPIQP